METSRVTSFTEGISSAAIFIYISLSSLFRQYEGYRVISRRNLTTLITDVIHPANTVDCWLRVCHSFVQDGHVIIMGWVLRISLRSTMHSLSFFMVITWWLRSLSCLFFSNINNTRWWSRNRLSVNIATTKCMILLTSAMLKNSDDIILAYSYHGIDDAITFKYLGIMLNM